MKKECRRFGGTSRLQLKIILQSSKVFYFTISAVKYVHFRLLFYDVGLTNFERSAKVSEEPATCFFISDDADSSLYHLQAPHSQTSAVLSS
jgi:hypothetical protein